MTDELHLGHIFKPALQDISLKRFRLRYSTFDDCYYLHWDNTVCPQLAKIQGLKRGIFSSSGIQRYVDNENGEAYLDLDKDADSAHIEWRVDFSSCGLVIMSMQIKMATPLDDDDECAPNINFLVRGDDMLLSPELGDFHTDLDDLIGCKKLSIIANIQPSSNGATTKFLCSCGDDNSIPLDIIIDLMCPRLKEEVYCGEILLGMKFSSGSDWNPNSPTDDGVIMDSKQREGQLQVHIVEGAGLVDEDTHKPFKTVVKCELLPATGKYSPKQTSPRHNAYPTWTKNFIFNGVTKEELITGGLEVILYDHHHFSSDDTIGGLRMCTPLRKENLSHNNSPLRSRSLSPAPNIIDQNEPVECNYTTSKSDLSCVEISSPLSSRRYMCKSLPHVPSSIYTDSPTLSPVPVRKATLNSPGSLSPNHFRNSQDLSDNSHGLHPNKGSPIAAAKNLFRLSGTHLKNTLTALSPHSSPRGSPRNSPLLGRRRFKVFGSHGSEEERENEFVHWWMEDVTSGEADHWNQMLEKEGSWIYYWHSIRYKLKAVYN